MKLVPLLAWQAPNTNIDWRQNIAMHYANLCKLVTYHVFACNDT